MFSSLDPDLDRHFVRPDLGSNCLQRLTADYTGRRRVKAGIIGLWFARLTLNASIATKVVC